MRIVFALALTILLSACGGSFAGAPTAAATATPKPATTAAPTPSAKATPRPAATDSANEICTVAANGGTFYLSVTSASEHDFRACSGDPLYAGTIDDVLNVPTVDRRCIADSNADIAQFHALVAVYSDQGNMAAANSFCESLGATMG